MEETYKEENKVNLFEIFNEWAELLSKENSDLTKDPNSLYSKIGNEIKQRCYELEKANANVKQNTPNADSSTSKNDNDSNAEKDFNPPFMFELKCDNTSVSSNNNMSPFECVYDFCSSLENFCKSKAAINNRWDIEKDWHKLLLACSSHNYERFMWIHLTFQADKNVKLGWKQVVRRLMTRFDDPQRIISLRSILTNFRYQPESDPLRSIFTVNHEFLRFADELGEDTKTIIEMYVNGLPDVIKSIIISTMQFDDRTNFKYTLLDIQQRAAVFISANKSKFIFYSKSGHLAIAIDYDKINNKDCELHLLANHSTISCPDLVIIRYPYMEFAPLAITTALYETSLNLPNTILPEAMTYRSINHQIKKENPNTISNIKNDTSNKLIGVNPQRNIQNDSEMTMPQTITQQNAEFTEQESTDKKNEETQTQAQAQAQAQAQGQHLSYAQDSTTEIAEQNKTLQKNEKKFSQQAPTQQTETSAQKVTSEETVEQNKQSERAENLSIQKQILTQKIPLATDTQSSKEPQEYIDMSKKQDSSINSQKPPVAATASISNEERRQIIPTQPSIRRDLSLPTNTKVSNSNQYYSNSTVGQNKNNIEAVYFRNSSFRSNSPNNHYPKRPLPHSNSPYYHRRSLSPESSPYYRRRLSSTSDTRKSKSPEIDCIIQNKGTNYVSDDLLLQTQPRSNINHRLNVNTSSRRLHNEPDSSPNICLFCGLLFKPGHLAYCKKVRSRRKYKY